MKLSIYLIFDDVRCWSYPCQFSLWN